MSNGEDAQIAEGEQFNLRNEAAELLGVPLDQIDGWQINRLRNDGAIDAQVPLTDIDVSGVPTDPRNVDYLIGLFNERQEQVGDTGQRDPVVIGHVPGDSFYMLDGFHRHETQSRRGHDQLHATVEPQLTFEEVVKRRLEYARTHSEVEFARQVEWMQAVWERTEWSDQVPNVLTAFRTCQDDYAFGKTDDVETLDGLSDKVFEEIQAWVREQSTEWGYTPAKIREKLAKAESFDPALMRYVYQKQGPTPAGRIGLGHIEVVAETYGGEFDMQQAVVGLILEHELTPNQSRELIKRLEDGSPVYAQDVEKLARKIDFSEIKSISKRKYKAVARKNRGGLQSLTPQEALKAMRNMLPDITASFEQGLFDEDAMDDLKALATAFGKLAVKDTASEEAEPNEEIGLSEDHLPASNGSVGKNTRVTLTPEQSKLALDNVELVTDVMFSVSVKFPRHVDRNDLIAAGKLGLVEAAKTFDASHGVPFDKFAPRRIRGAILDHVRGIDFAPRSVRSLERRVATAEQKLAPTLNRMPTAREIAEELELPTEDVESFKARRRKGVVLSLEYEVPDADEDLTLSDVLSDNPSYEPEVEIISREDLALLRDAIELLPTRHRAVIVGYFLEERSSMEIAERLGVTESRVSQLRAEALSKVRQAIDAQYGNTENGHNGSSSSIVDRRRKRYAEAVAQRSDWKSRIS